MQYVGTEHHIFLVYMYMHVKIVTYICGHKQYVLF